MSEDIPYEDSIARALCRDQCTQGFEHTALHIRRWLEGCDMEAREMLRDGIAEDILWQKQHGQ